MKIDFEEIINNLKYKADKMYKDNVKLQELIEKAKKKAEGNEQLMKVWDDLKLLMELIKDWIKGDYTDLPQDTAILIIIALIYLVSPIDLIPDFLPGGFIDDMLVIAYVVKKISHELDSYKKWKVKEEEIIEEEDIFER